MTRSTRFNRFLDNLTLTNDQIEDAKTKYNGVAGKLHNHYYNNHFTGDTCKLIGSYGKDTAVRPPRDVDILFLLPKSVHDQYDAYTGNSQSKLLQEVRKVLLEKYSATKIRGDGQVVVVPFSNGHTIELLPGWRTTKDNFLVPNTHDGGRWQVVDHDAEIAQVNNSDERSNGNTRKLIKMLKAWQRECDVPIGSLVIELRAVNFLRKWKYFDKVTYHDWIIRDFFGELIEYSNGKCKMPGTKEEIHYGDKWMRKAESASKRAKKACQYESEKRERSAAEEWRKIFGSQYEY